MTHGKPVYNDNKVHVITEQCPTCVFRPGNLMHLPPGRLKELVDGNLANGAAITCHETTYGQADQEATCRGYFDAYKDVTLALKMAELMGIIEEVEPRRA